MKKVTGNQIVDEIKSVANIVDVIGDVVSLTKKGANYHGLCPFHNEKTPSFVVSETKQIFTCFGCHATGDVIEFVKKYNNIEFVEALEKLADRYGIKYEKFNRKSENSNKYYEINKEAAIFFYKNLISKKAENKSQGLSYVKKRNLLPETILKFGIGYADATWNSLYKHLKNKGYEEKHMMELGLISQSKGKYFDKFRNRLIFPIFNVRGDIIGFGGRAIGDDMPKYLNSPENYVFSKKNNLYGLNVAKEFIMKENMVIMVEGYMDVVSLYQHGVKNAVASLGTALTENQSKLVKRYTKNVALCYDSDSAGVNAAIRGGNILYRDGINVRVVNVTDGKDPDEFIKGHGKSQFVALIDKGKTYVEYVVDSIRKKFNIDKIEEKIAFIRKVGEFLNSLSPAEKDIYIESLANDLAMNKEVLLMEISRDSDDNLQRVTTERRIREKNETAEVSGDMLRVEESLLRVLFEDDEFVERLKTEFINREIQFKSILAGRIFETVLREYESKEKVVPVEVMEKLHDSDARKVQRILNKELKGNLEGEFRGSLDNLEKIILNHRMDEIKKTIAVLEQEEDGEKVQKEIGKLALEHRKILEKSRRNSK